MDICKKERNENMEIFEMQIGEIIPYENNPRINGQAIDPVKNSIREFGFKVPILVDKNNIIITGHTRILAAKEIGMDTVPAIRIEDLSEEQVNAFRLADNKVAEYAYWDNERLIKEIEQISSINMTELFGFFDEQRFQNLDDLMQQPDNIDEFFADAEPKKPKEELGIKVTVIPADEDEYSLLEKFLEENHFLYHRD